jgi:succinate dehydrogenase / fumarate reductase cytochrome b subunit
LKLFEGVDTSTGIYHIDKYAEALRQLGGDLAGPTRVLWGVRIALLLCVILHVTCAMQLTRRSQQARPVGYHRQGFLSATVASRTMAVGGMVISLFIVFHILHFTTGTVHFANFREGAVYANVYNGFSSWQAVLIYVVALTAIAMHLYHGAWSMFQTLGMDSPQWNTFLRQGAKLLALGLWITFLSVPLAVFFGFLEPPLAQHKVTVTQDDSIPG